MPAQVIGVFEPVTPASVELYVAQPCHEQAIHAQNTEEAEALLTPIPAPTLMPMFTPTASDAQHAHSLCSSLGHACCVGMALLISMPPALTVFWRHSQPTHRACSVARWLHAPDLRPPIYLSKN